MLQEENNKRKNNNIERQEMLKRLKKSINPMDQISLPKDDVKLHNQDEMNYQTGSENFHVILENQFSLLYDEQETNIFIEPNDSWRNFENVNESRSRNRCSKNH
jgi:hypothetical protein